MYLVVCRFIVGFGVTGLYSVDITLMQEFSPAHKRGWFTGLTTTMLPAGSLLGGAARRLCRALYRLARPVSRVGLLPALLCLYIRAFVPESPHWLLRMGRVEEARKSLAWALQIDPATIPLPAVPAAGRADALARAVQISAQHHRRLPDRADPDRRRRAVAVAGHAVRHGAEDHPGRGLEAGDLGQPRRRSSAGSSARGFRMRWGRRASGIFSCVDRRRSSWSLAGYLHNVFIGGVSMFFVMILLQSFLGSGNYSIVGPYMGELWPARLRGSGMGLVYGVGNLGKFIGPAGLALIAGSSNFVKPEATLDALVPGFLLFRLLVPARRLRLLADRHRDARPHDRRDRRGDERACRRGPPRSSRRFAASSAPRSASPSRRSRRSRSSSPSG